MILVTKEDISLRDHLRWLPEEVANATGLGFSGFRAADSLILQIRREPIEGSTRARRRYWLWLHRAVLKKLQNVA